MKKMRASFLFLFALSLNCVYASGLQWECKVSNSATGQINQMVSINQPLIIIMVDFPDGRLPNGSLPTQDSDTALVANIDAVGSLGFNSSFLPPQNGPSRAKINKYVYEDYWDMVFSTNIWVGDRHPDFYDLLSYDPDGAGSTEKPFDLTVYGSVTDYWKEVSYGNLLIQAYQTHSGSMDKYHTGIVNNIISIGGNNYVRWIKLDYNKTVYFLPPDSGGRKDSIIADVKAKVHSLHQLPISDPDYLEFDLDHYPSSGKIAIITAGGKLGGWAPALGGQNCIVPEKMQYLTNNDRYSFLTAIGELAHEFGHTIGLPHYIAGPYDLMFWGGFSERREYFSPPHINPKDKIKLGWIPFSNINRINSNQSCQLPPINTTPEIAAVTIYGDAGRDSDYTHSEYLLIEYRKREGFNRFTGGIDAAGFVGGGLIWHYSAYNAFSLAGDMDPHLGLKVANYGTSFWANPGDPSQLFFPGHSTLSSSTIPNSNSVSNLVTGLNLNNFSYSGNNLSFTVNYDLGAPPQYDFFLDTGYDVANNRLSGKIFVGAELPSFSSLTLASGSQVIFAPNMSVKTSDLIANGSSDNPIIFQGVGYGSQRNRWGGIRMDAPHGGSVINFCTFQNSIGGLDIYNPLEQFTISNSLFQDNSSWDIRLFKGKDLPRYLPNIDENTMYSRLLMGGNNWLSNPFQTFTIPSGGILDMVPGTEICFDVGSSIASSGQLRAIGSSSSKVRFTSASGNNPGSWDGIAFSGSAASSSSMSYCTIENSYGVQCYDGANISINNSTISNNTYGILCYGADPVVTNNTISNSVYRGIQNAMNANPRIEGNTISNDIVTTNSYGVYCYGGSGYINSNKITGFEIGVYPRSNSYLGGWSGLDYNQTPIQNNVIMGNTYGVDTYDQGHAFLGYIDNNGVIHGGNNYIGANTGYDLVANNFTWLYAAGNWFGTDERPSFAQGSSVYAFYYDRPLERDPWGEIYQKMDAPFQETMTTAKSVASNVSDALDYQANNDAQNTEEKLYREAVRDHMTKSFGSARDKYKQLVPSSRYGKSALVLLSRLLIESKDETALTCMNDIITNRQKYFLSEQNLPLATNLLANLEGYKGNHNNALALYDKVIKEYPNTIDERNARIQKIYYVITGKKNQTAAKQLVNELLAIYNSGDDIDMILNLYNHAKYSSLSLSKSSSNQQQMESIKEEFPKEFSVSQNYPNPFNPSTTISYAIPQTCMVSIKVFDLLGREVTTLVNEYKTEGRYSVTFNASQLSSGIYIYRIQAGSFTSTKKMQLLK